MWRRLAIGAFCLVCLIMGHATSVSAATLKISPLRYDTTLKAGEVQKGFVDITNPTADTTTVKLSVQAFRQTDNSGSLEFYDNETVKSGILLDYSDVELGPRETLHLAFLIDGSKLPSGDTFAAIFATSVPDNDAAGQQTVKVGTLLIITNGTPSAHNAVIENLTGSLFQLGNGLHITFDVHNTAEIASATGFTPMITVKAWPYVHETVTGPLVFAGRTRTVDYSKAGDYLGILAIHVKTGDSEQVIYRVAITGFWRFVLPIIAFAAAVGGWFFHYVQKRSNNSSKTD